MNNTKHCEGCYHYFATNGTDKGVCKLNPPVPFPMQTLNALKEPQLTVVSMPVNVTANDWCGCWMSNKVDMD